jgi:lysophospholipase L1-like esterase
MLTALLGRLGRWRLSRPVADLIRRRRGLPAVTPDQQAAVTDGLVRIVDGVRARAPQARVVLVDYLPMFTDSVTDPGVPLTATELDHFRGMGAHLSEAYAQASRRTGADLVPGSAYGRIHGAGAPDPWVDGLRLRAMASSFHPTLSGMRAVADAVLEVLVSTDPPAS